MKQVIYSSICFFIFLLTVTAGEAQFSIGWRTVKISGMPSLHSYAWGSLGTEYIFIGGRRDGLHPKQPWLSFHQQYNNDSIYVVNPAAQKVWSAGLAALPPELREQLSSSNMQFAQSGDSLVIAGGYGYHEPIDDKKTFPALILVRLPDLIRSVKAGIVIPEVFQTFADERFAVCGGQMEIMNGWFYLVGGHRFDGSYNPKGNPTYVQTYTSAIRKFGWEKKDGTVSGILFAPENQNENLFRRRDYNLAPALDKTGHPKLALFSGVFQKDKDLPYRDVVEIGETEIVHRSDFTPYFNHYHTAHMEGYDSTLHMMHFYFIGGLSEYYMENGQLLQDSNVPFTRTVSHITRNEIGEYREYYLKEELPGFLGSGAQFLSAPGVPRYPNGVIDMASIREDSLLLGWAVGGITASERNVFWTNDGDQSHALNDWVEIYAIKQEDREVLHPLSSSGLALECYTNLEMDEFNMSFVLKEPANVDIRLERELENATTGIIGLSELGVLESGPHEFLFEFEQQLGKGYYYFVFTKDGTEYRIKVFIG